MGVGSGFLSSSRFSSFVTSGQLRRLAEPWNFGKLASDTQNVTPPPRTAYKQDGTHQAFSRVVVHSRRSKVETGSWAMHATAPRVCPRLRRSQSEGPGDRKPDDTGRPPPLRAPCRHRGLIQRRAAAGALRWGSGGCPRFPAHNWLPRPLLPLEPRVAKAREKAGPAGARDGEGPQARHPSAVPSRGLEPSRTQALSRGLPQYSWVRILSALAHTGCKM